MSKLMVVTVGYNKLVFNNNDQAIQLFRLANQSVVVTHRYGKLPDGREGIIFIKSDIELSIESIDSEAFELNHTEDEIKAMLAAREPTEPTDVSIAPTQTKTDDIPF